VAPGYFIHDHSEIIEYGTSKTNRIVRANVARRAQRRARSGRAIENSEGLANMIDLVITLAVLVLILALVWWLVTLLPLPEPFPLIIRVVFVIIAVIVIIDLLLSLRGGGLGLYPLRR
jgi:hypothetical protein